MSGNIQPQLFQLAEPLWTDPGIKSGFSVSEVIPTLRKKKERRQEMSVEYSPKILASEDRDTITMCMSVHKLLSVCYLTIMCLYA